MTDEHKMKFVEYLSLRCELENVESRGTSLLLDGTGARPEDIAMSCVFNEECDYMRDYITNREGHLEKLNFDAVRAF